MNWDKLLSMWFIIFLICGALIIYRAMMALDFSRNFRSNSTWQIRLLCLFSSIAISYLVSSAVIEVIENFLKLVTLKISV